MKMIRLFTVFSLAIFSLNISAQCVNGTKSYPIYKAGAQLVNELDNQEKEIVRIEYDLVFSSKETFRNLSSDWEYTIMVFADDGVKDIDLKLYEYDDLLEQWTMVKEDNAAESTASLVIQPTVTAQYKIEVIVYEFYEGYTAARYGLLVYHD
jgi:hypothetical protein